MVCRIGCGACCIAPSISSTIPGTGTGKPAGVRCFQLTADNRCKLFGCNTRPSVCSGLQPSEDMCGNCAEDAMERLAEWERRTEPYNMPH